MFKNLFKSSIYLTALTIVSIVGAVLINAALAVWTGPTADPPEGNVSNVSGWTDSGTNVSLTTATDLVGIGTAAPNRQLHIYQTTGNNAEIDLQSVAGASEYWALYHDRSTGELRFWNNNVISTSTKNAFVVTASGYVKAATPVNSGDVATKGYVDAAVGAAGGGDATLANQESIMGTGFDATADSLKAISGKIPALVGTATYDKQVEIANMISLANGWVLPNQTYYSVGGNTYFCRQNAVNGTGAVTVTSINNNQQCDIENGITWRCTNGACVKGLTYAGTTHSEADCISASGAIVSDSNNKTFCKFSGANVSCPSGWTPAGSGQVSLYLCTNSPASAVDNIWQKYSRVGWGTQTNGDNCSRHIDSAPLVFSNTYSLDCWTTSSIWPSNYSCSFENRWFGSNESTNYGELLYYCSTNFASDRIEIGCK